jgi:hypothetical protein
MGGLRQAPSSQSRILGGVIASFPRRMAGLGSVLYTQRQEMPSAISTTALLRSIIRDVGTNNDQYHFLGESYVDRLMYGEDFELEAANEKTMFVLR